MKVILLLALAAQDFASASFRKLAFTPGQETVEGTYRFQLEGPDNASKPTLWEGPLRIASEEKSCEARVSLVSAVWLQPRTGYAIVLAESGESTYVHFVDLASCAAKWPRLKAFTEGVNLLPERLQILPACSCGGPGAPCSCSSAQVFRLRADGAPVRLETESLSLTKEKLGVAFIGNRRVSHPKTSQARLLAK